MMNVMMLFLVACGGNKDSSGDSAPPINQGDSSPSESCEGTAPEITDLRVSDGGVYNFGDAGELPSVLIEADASDADADLNVMAIDVWWSESGAPDTSTEPQSSGGPSQVRDTPCAVSSATFGLYVALTGDPLAFSTSYTFAAVVYDAAGLVSAAATTTATTPAE